MFSRLIQIELFVVFAAKGTTIINGTATAIYVTQTRRNLDAIV
jgi:hypothetical protein